MIVYREPAATAQSVQLTTVIEPASWWRRREPGVGRLEQFLGPRVLIGADGFTSLDRARRVRFERTDGKARFEQLDLTRGITRRCHRARLAAPTTSPVRVPIAFWHARVLGRSTAQVCFDGLPSTLGGQPRATSARLVRLFEHLDGVRLARLGPGGVLTGDSWHESLSGAVRQLEHEFASHVGGLRPGLGAVVRSRSGVWT